MYACLAVTCHLHFWQNDLDFLRATVVTRGWSGYRNKSQHRKSTLEKKILPPFQQGFEPATFQSRVRRSNHWAIPAPCEIYHTLPHIYEYTGRSDDSASFHFFPLFVILNWPTSWVSCGQTQSECMSVPLHVNALEISESEDHPLSPPEVVCSDWPGSWRACLFDLPSRREKKHAMTAWYWKASKHLYVLGIVRKDLDKHLIKQKSMICYRDVAGRAGVEGGGGVRVLSEYCRLLMTNRMTGFNQSMTDSLCEFEVRTYFANVKTDMVRIVFLCVFPLPERERERTGNALFFIFFFSVGHILFMRGSN